MRLRFLSVTAVLAFSLTCFGGTSPERVGGVDGVLVNEMAVERLPDLNVPRSAHTVAYVGGELTVNFTRERVLLTGGVTLVYDGSFEY